MESASPFSHFLFAQPLLRHGFRNKLSAEDALQPPKWTSPTVLCDAFEAAWQSELSHFAAVPGRGRASVLRVLWRLLGVRFLGAMAIQVLSVCCRFGAAMAVRRLTALLIEGSESGEGYWLAGGLFALSYLEGVFATNANVRMSILALAAYNIFATAVIRKGMRLGPSARGQYPRGVLVSLGLSECNRLVESAMTMAMGTTIPFQVLGAVALGCFVIGPVFCICLLSVFCVAHLMWKLGKRMGQAFRRKAISQGLRLAIVNEMLQSMKLTKYYALEEHFEQAMMNNRRAELSALLRMKLLLGVNWALSLVLPLITAVLVILSHRLAYGTLPSVPNLFATLAIIKVLSVPFAFFGNFLGTLTMLAASAGRLRELLLQPEVSRRQLLPKSESVQSAVSIDRSSFSWKGAEDVVLPNLSLEVASGQLVVLVGELGSGKSSVLSAILGEMHDAPGVGSVKVHATQIAYCAQEPMIMNANVRENVLFGLSFHAGRYAQAVDAAVLGPDLEQLPAGDMTEIGEKGLSLSGGQKARVAVARALFAALANEDPSDSLVLLDDPLSAVDVHVGARLWDQAICGALSGTTRLLVTNQLQYLSHPEVTEILVLERGQIVERGSHGQLLAKPGGCFVRMLESLQGVQKKATRGEDTSCDASGSVSGKSVRPFVASQSRVTVDERKEEGSATWETVRFYLRSLSSCSWSKMCFLFLCSWSYNIGETMPDMFLAMWQSGIILTDVGNGFAGISIWFAAGVLGLFLALTSRCTWAFASVNAARRVHNLVLDRVLACPMTFFDSTPSGRVMNRLGEDQMNVDWTVSLQVEVLCLVVAMLVNNLILVFGVCPQLMLELLIFVPLVVLLREIHRRTTREGVRFWMLTKTPMFHVMEETLSGVPTVAAFGRSAFFLHRFESAVAENNAWLFTKDLTNQWAEQRLQFVGAVVITSLTAALTAWPGLVPPSVAAMALIYALQISQYLRWFAFFLVQVESSLSSVERSLEFTKLDQEAPRRLADDAQHTADGWPGEAPEVVFEDVHIRYRPHLPLVIEGLSARLLPKEKVGIVGRTGSGKSTLLSCLFRLVEPCDGRILIGDVDIAGVGLGLLRRRITTVPQDPLLFAGSLQHNLDPTEKSSDFQVIDSLRRCGMEAILDRLDGGLQANVAEQGSNFSVGERQVLCLARALLRGTKIMCLDEATANIDPESDRQIQRTIRSEFRDCTMLTIAHRLHTVMEADRIMVMDQGSLAEFDSPSNLLQLRGQFHAMVVEAGIDVRISQGAETTRSI